MGERMKPLVAKLTDDQVRQMRAEYYPYARGKGYLSMARKFQCCESTARDICTYRTRKNVR